MQPMYPRFMNKSQLKGQFTSKIIFSSYLESEESDGATEDLRMVTKIQNQTRLTGFAYFFCFFIIIYFK